jgi:uncharacterized protein YndB with AHSA1/START domain
MNIVELTSLFNAPKNQVWNAWTHPSIIKRWFGSDPAGIVLKADLDVRPGGAYAITFQDSNTIQHTCLGRYSEVTPNKLSFSWEWESEPGHVSQVDIQFIEVGDQMTTMKFEHSNLNPNSFHGYEEGWKRTFEKLKSVL